ncbi:MAG: hypothetical protein RL115_604 [Bacteroidota bacterium]|jgi:hypothetical protein
MKKILLLIPILFTVALLHAQTSIHTVDSTKKMIKVAASCGECQFKMEGKGCHLAVKIDGKNYFVDGTNIDDHGDAHGASGFCEAIRKAEVQGEIVNNRFKATYFKVLPIIKEDATAPQGHH